jgi:hypothetical protein
MKNRGWFVAVLIVTGALAAYGEQATFKGVTLLSRSTNPQRATGLAGPAAVVAQSRSTNPQVAGETGSVTPQVVLTLDSKKKTLTSSQPGGAALVIPYAQITGAEYDAGNERALTVHYTASGGSVQQLVIGLPAAQAERILTKFQSHTGKTVTRK